MGEQVAETMVELFADLPPDHEFFEQFSFISANDLPEYQTILGRTAKGGLGQLDAPDRAKLLSLPFKLIVARHRLDLLDEAMQARIVEARKIFADGIPAALEAEDRVLRCRALQRRLDPPGQRAVRQDRLRRRPRRRGASRR